MAGFAVMKDHVRLFVWSKNGSVAASDKVGNISQLGDIGGDTEEIDTTTIDSMAKEYVLGFFDAGSVDITQNVTENEYNTMAARADQGEEIRWGVSAFNAAGTQILGLQGHGFVKNPRLTGISVGGLLQSVAALRITGSVNRDFVDPIGGHFGKPVTAITVAGVGGATGITTDGGTLQCVASITPDDAANKAVTWSSSDTTKATVSETGLVTAVADGTVTITATAKDGSGVTGTMSVTISNQA